MGTLPKHISKKTTEVQFSLRVILFGLFAGWFLGWFGLAGAGLLWEENTVDWLIYAGWNQQANGVIEVNSLASPILLLYTEYYILRIAFVTYKYNGQWMNCGVHRREYWVHLQVKYYIYIFFYYNEARLHFSIFIFLFYPDHVNQCGNGPIFDHFSTELLLCPYLRATSCISLRPYKYSVARLASVG